MLAEGALESSIVHEQIRIIESIEQGALRQEAFNDFVASEAVLEEVTWSNKKLV